MSVSPVAAIDLGTNNCRLLMAVPTADGFRVIGSFSRIVRLGEGLEATGLLSAAAMDRTAAALSICAEHLKENGITRVRAIATHACRKAKNAGELVARVKAETGIDLEIISDAEEARLAAVGCAPLIGKRYQGALVFDVGGGSTEVIWMQRSGESVETLHAQSIPVGVVSLAERYSGKQDRAWYDTLEQRMRETFSPVRAAMSGFDENAHHLLGTSGTVTTLAGVALGLDRYVRSKVDTSWHDRTTILDVVDRIVALDIEGRAALGCVGPERADLIVSGCAIFAAIAALWPCAQLRVADRGLREGILRELVAEVRA